MLKKIGKQNVVCGKEINENDNVHTIKMGPIHGIWHRHIYRLSKITLGVLKKLKELVILNVFADISISLLIFRLFLLIR